MRKLSIILFALLLSVGVAFAATPGYRQNPGTGDVLGQGKYQSDAHKIFRMVRYVPTGAYASSSTLAADSIVVWDVTNDDGVTVTTTTTSYDSTVAGIIVTQALTPDTDGNTAAEDAGKRNWTWLQTYGMSQVNYMVGEITATAGDAFGTSTVAGEAARFLPSTSDPGLNGKAGFMYDASLGAADDVEVFILGLD